MRIIIILVFIIVIFNFVIAKDKYNILIGVPVASRSLHHLFSALGFALAEAGHNVTLFTSFNESKKHDRLHHFQPDDFSAPLAEKPENIFYNQSTFTYMWWVLKSNVDVIDMLWNNEAIWQLYERRKEFDIIITPSYANEPIFPLFHGYEGVYVMVCTPGIEYFSILRSGHVLPPSVIPSILVPYDEYMTFFERSFNLFNILISQNFLRIVCEYFITNHLKIYHPETENIFDYYQKSSLTLINGHFALDGPVPLLPNQIEIGTINAEKPKPLPKDLEEFVQGSGEAGIIYFSLGSFVLGKEIPQNIKEILVETFRQIPHRVIWKYEENDLDLPPNVWTSKWLPQQDILGHPKTKIFMSHCGNLGTQEAKYHGVPVLAVPVAFDQPRNAARLARKNYGVVVNWVDISVEKLLAAIHTLTKDSAYYDRMKNMSKILQDQKETPAERAVWWIEYVARHKGAPHLRYAGQRLAWYQYIMLDVLIFWMTILSLLLYIFFWVCRRVWRTCFGSSKVKRE